MTPGPAPERGTTVVFDWGDQRAEMPGPPSDFLNRAESTPPVDHAGPPVPTQTG